MRLLAAVFVWFLLMVPIVPMLEDQGGSVEAASLPSWTRVFHLHEGFTQDIGQYDWMNSSGPYNPAYTDYDLDGLPGITIKKNVPPQRWHHWFLYPPLGRDMTLVGEFSAYVWAKSRDNVSGSQITAIVFDMPPGTYGTPASWTELGRTTTPLLGPVYSEFQLYNLSIPLAATIPAGHFLVLTVQRGDSLNDWLLVWFDKSDYDSYVVLRTTTFVDVSSVFTKDSGGLARSVFSDQENALVEANVTNLYGSQEILGADLSVRYAVNGTSVVGSSPMSLLQTDPSSPSYWKRYEAMLPQLGEGSYTIKVTASDPQGSPTWLECNFTVVTVDHFYIEPPASATAGLNFTITITAKDSMNNTANDWIGSVSLEPFKTDLMTPGNGTLTIASVIFETADAGVIAIPNETYSFGDELIRIRASSGPKVGWSAILSVRSGPVAAVEIADPSVPSVTIDAGVPLSVTARGLDSLGNENLTWTPYWTVAGGIGSLQGSGRSVVFIPEVNASGSITCTDNASGAFATLYITVAAAMLDHITIDMVPPLVIEEGLSQMLTATGYDAYGNEVNLTGAWWETNTSGTIVSLGWGQSATYTAGMIPESGEIHVRKGSIVGSLSVIVTTSQHGPWFNGILPQTVLEDAGSWDLSLVQIWNHEDGTDELMWWAEGVDTSLYFIAHDPYSNSIIHFYTQPNQFGESSFVLWAVDPLGYRARITVSVIIQPVNDPPEFVNGPPTQLYVKFETPYLFDYAYYVWDVDNGLSELSMYSSSGNIDFTGLVGTFLFPKKDGDKSYFEFVTLNLSDGAAAAELKIVVWVTSDTPPTLTKDLPDREIFEGTMNYLAFDLDEYFYDQDNDTLYFSYGFKNVVVTINSTSHEVFLSAPYEWAGTEEGIFSASDPTGAIKIDSVKVKVIAVNDPPELLSDIDTIYVKYNATYSLYLGPILYDPDNSMDSLGFSIAAPNDVFVKHKLSISGAHKLEITFPAALNGSGVFVAPYSVIVTMTVRDPEGATLTCQFEVNVTDDAPPIVIVPNPEGMYYSFREDGYLNGSIRLYSMFFDPDDAILGLNITGQKNIRVAIYNGVVNLSAAVNWSGTETLIVKATDGHGGWASVRAYVTVTPVNDAPVIYQIPNFINRGSSFRNAHYPILQYVYDSDNPFSELKFTVTPSGNVFVIGQDLYVSLPEGVNVLTVTIQAFDGELSSNIVTFKVGVERTMAEKLGWPYSFPLVLLAAGVASYFGASRLPRPHALENLFLIHNDGRLVAHVTKEENTTIDKDVVSAMFTAVQEFVRDSFQKGEVGLKKLEIGDKNVLIEKGRSVYLALIYSGWPEKETFAMLPMLLRDIEERYKERISSWNGTMKTVKGVDKMLQEFMADAYKPGVWVEEEELAEKEWVDILSKEA